MTTPYRPVEFYGVAGAATTAAIAALDALMDATRRDLAALLYLVPGLCDDDRLRIAAAPPGRWADELKRVTRNDNSGF